MLIISWILAGCSENKVLIITKKDKIVWDSLINQAVANCNKTPGRKALYVEKQWNVRSRLIEEVNKAQFKMKGDTLIIEEDFTGDPPEDYVIRLKTNKSLRVLGYTVDKTSGQGRFFIEQDSLRQFPRWKEYLDTLDINIKIYECDPSEHRSATFLIEIPK